MSFDVVNNVKPSNNVKQRKKRSSERFFLFFDPFLAFFDSDTSMESFNAKNKAILSCKHSISKKNQEKSHFFAKIFGQFKKK